MMSKKSELQRTNDEARILEELKEGLVVFGRQGTRCCELVADYMALWPIKTDHKIVIPELARDLGLSESRIYQMWKAGTVSPMLLDNVEKPEAHLRPLAPLVKRGQEIVRKAWADAQELAEEGGESLTAEHVKEAADRYRPIMDVTQPATASSKKQDEIEKVVRSCIRNLDRVVSAGNIGSDSRLPQIDKAITLLQSTVEWLD